MAINLADTWQLWWTVDSTQHPNEFAMFHVSTEANQGTVTMEARTAQCFDAMVAFWVSLGGMAVVGAAELVMVHANMWDTTLLVPGWREIARREFLPGTHDYLGSTLPPQIAIAVTLKTGELVPGNRQSRYNRFYIPYIPAANQSGGIIGAPVQTNILTYVETLNASIGATGTTGLLVVSETQGLGFGTVEARVGNVCDTQRRRRNQIVEEYAAQLLS